MDANNFRTSIPSKKSDLAIDHQSKILTIGSCFSDVIGGYLIDYKFDVLSNPFGTVYNPISIFNYIDSFEFSEEHLVESNELIFHLDAHSQFNAREKATLQSLLKIQGDELHDHLKSTTCLVVTLGTAFVYTYKKSQKVVANCHKIPQTEFSKRLLTMDEIKQSFELSLNFLKKENPKLQILLTVSPVRHIKDGIEENSISKSLLRAFCHDAVNKHDNVHYFPSYEIMMDDLRDYRFYREDMIHPNSVAEDYIWKFFQKTFFSAETKETISDWKKVLNAKNHKPFNSLTESHQLFLRNTLRKLEQFKNKFDVSEEIRYFESQLI